jgi:hypothetical protein
MVLGMNTCAILPAGTHKTCGEVQFHRRAVLACMSRSRRTTSANDVTCVLCHFSQNGAACCRTSSICEKKNLKRAPTASVLAGRVKCSCCWMNVGLRTERAVHVRGMENILPPYRNIRRCWFFSRNFDHSSYSKNYRKHVKWSVKLKIHTTIKHTANKINCTCIIFWIKRMVKVVKKINSDNYFDTEEGVRIKIP